ncbi:cytochrome d ubiquinol oxidase subunit I [Geminocystis sp. NIES-3708]|nr:cytochrome ubiquinol oxidase subunit I [Geminocystis sp. NIES-3708]BAQ61701.1 cytochrome d ubiquinol oxidase subunit I [Geminocystis sp. NIES-3708]
MANPFMIKSVSHMFLATLETSLFVIGGISAWYLINKRNTEFFSKSLKIVLVIAIAITPLQIFVGHLSAEQVYYYQPTKLAAMEAQWETIPAGETADWSLLAFPNEKAETNNWEINIPNALGYILEFKPHLTNPVLGLKEFAPSDRPKMVVLIYYSFRLMSGIAFILVGVVMATVVQWLRGKLSVENINQQKLLLISWIGAAPLGYLAVESGWIVRCVGRQPWTVYGEIRTVDAVSNLPAGDVLTSLLIFLSIYTLLFFCALFFASRIIKKGPDFDLPIPGEKAEVTLNPSQHIPDSRPIN